jgi:hypothetical protein
MVKISNKVPGHPLPCRMGGKPCNPLIWRADSKKGLCKIIFLLSVRRTEKDEGANYTSRVESSDLISIWIHQHIPQSHVGNIHTQTISLIIKAQISRLEKKVQVTL